MKNMQENKSSYHHVFVLTGLCNGLHDHVHDTVSSKLTLEKEKPLISIKWSNSSSCNRNFAEEIDHPNQNFYSLPPGGADTDKQNSSIQLDCACLGRGHLTAINGTTGFNFIDNIQFWKMLRFAFPG